MSLPPNKLHLVEQAWTAPRPDGAASEEFLEAANLTKRFGSLVALNDASFRCRLGEIHAVVGENGAGKSTLLKILGGTIRPDSGSVTIDGAPLPFGNARIAARAGVARVYQELSIVPDLTVAENVFLLSEPTALGGVVKRRTLRRDTQELFADLGIAHIDPDVRARRLSLAQKQVVEIAKAAARDARIIILDEPTSALAETEALWLLGLMRRWRDEGRCVIFVSHRYSEIESVADRLSIYRNGQFVGCYGKGELSDAEVVERMCGRPIETLFPERRPPSEESPEMLAVSELQPHRSGGKVSFSARRGEIVGIAGLAGQGQLDLFLALFGAISAKGQITVEGKPIRIRRPADATAAGIGIALVPAERKTEGLLMGRSVRENMTLPALRLVSRLGFLRRGVEERHVRRLVDELHISVRDIDAPVQQLSGGNQQKVLIAKWILTGARVLLLFDVTRGVDIATKTQIYQMIADFAAAGGTVLLYSTDTLEIVHLCHRSLVLREREIVEEFGGDELEEQTLIAAALKGAGKRVEAV